MTNPRDPDGSYRVGQDTGTTTGRTTSDVTGRMAPPAAVSHTETIRPVQTEHGLNPYKTSAAAAFALVFGLAALFCALTGILSPAAVLFGVIGVVLGIVGMKMARRPHVTGRGVALGGLITALLGLLLGGAVLGGLAAVVNNQNALDRISTQVDKLKAELPSGTEVKNSVK